MIAIILTASALLIAGITFFAIQIVRKNRFTRLSEPFVESVLKGRLRDAYDLMEQISRFGKRGIFADNAKAAYQRALVILLKKAQEKQQESSELLAAFNQACEMQDFGRGEEILREWETIHKECKGMFPDIELEIARQSHTFNTLSALKQKADSLMESISLSAGIDDRLSTSAKLDAIRYEDNGLKYDWSSLDAIKAELAGEIKETEDRTAQLIEDLSRSLGAGNLDKGRELLSQCQEIFRENSFLSSSKLRTEFNLLGNELERALNAEMEMAAEARRRMYEKMKACRVLYFTSRNDACSLQEELLGKEALLIPMVRVDAGSDPQTCARYGIDMAPSFLLADGEGREMARWTGNAEPSMINDYLVEHGIVPEEEASDYISAHANTTVEPISFTCGRHVICHDGGEPESIEASVTITVEPNVNGCHGFYLKPGDGYIVRAKENATGREAWAAMPMRLEKARPYSVRFRGYRTETLSPLGWVEFDGTVNSLEITVLNGMIEKCTIMRSSDNLRIDYLAD